MNKVKVLVEGYAKQVGDHWQASSTSTLIESNGKKIVVDPGSDRKKLLDGLHKEGLKPSDIDYVIITHTHLDHCMLIGIFENVVVVEEEDLHGFDGSIKPHKGVVPGTDVKIVKTPGHDMFHCTALVKTEEYGTVAVAADLFWWQASQEQKIDMQSLINHEDPFMKDKKQLETSRRKVLELADYIIPGHGKMFEVKK